MTESFYCVKCKEKVQAEVARVDVKETTKGTKYALKGKHDAKDCGTNLTTFCKEEVAKKYMKK